MTKIIGVRYVGKKSGYVDKILNSGATWSSSGEVVNFSVELANVLIKKHGDMFQEAPVDANATVILSVPGSANPKPVAVMNIANADSQQIAAFARMHYSKILDASEPPESLRFQLLNAMEMAANQSEQPKLERYAVPFPLTPEEYAALMQGVCELRLVPVVVPAAEQFSAQVPTTPVKEAEAAIPPVTEIKQEAQAPVLEDLLETLDADGLEKFAQDNGVKIDKRWSDERTRKEISVVLRTRAGEGAQ
jgi:hypothetical protein